MTPVQTVDMTGGKILHMTMEVDGHQSKRKWMGFNMSPASDPLAAWHPDGGVPLNNTNRGVFLELQGRRLYARHLHGAARHRAPTGTAGGPRFQAVGRQRLQRPTTGEFETYVPGNFSRNGLGFDDKSRFDFFISETRAALFQDGH